MSIWSNPVSKLIEGVTSVFQKKQDRKLAVETGKAKLNLAKESNSTSITLTDAEGEAILASKTDSTWKDEYVTIIITAPIAIIIAGTVYFAFTSDDRLLIAGIESIKALNLAGIDMGFMMEAVVLAALGLKIWRKS
jgi:hypothetical protein